MKNAVYLPVIRSFPLKLKRQTDVRTDGELVKDVVLLKNEPHIGIAVGVEMLLTEIAARNSVNYYLAAVFIVTVKPAEKVEER